MSWPAADGGKKYKIKGKKVAGGGKSLFALTQKVRSHIQPPPHRPNEKLSPLILAAHFHLATRYEEEEHSFSTFFVFLLFVGTHNHYFRAIISLPLFPLRPCVLRPSLPLRLNSRKRKRKREKGDREKRQKRGLRSPLPHFPPPFLLV